MFIGHFAVGMAAKRAAPRASLAAYFAAAQLADVLWPALVLVGLERVSIVPGVTAFTPLRFDSYPISHSLLTDIVWGLLFGGVAWRVTRSAAVGVASGIAVVSHWVLDFATHAPDMPVWPGGPRLGLGLWNSVPGTLAVEGVMFAVGVWLYASGTTARDGKGRWGLGVLVAVLLATYLAASFGPPPPSVTAVAVSALFGVPLFFWLAWWVDRHRATASEPARA